MTHSTRIDKLKRMLAARTGPDGRPLPNFGENVSAIRAEIAKLEARIAQ